MSAADHDRFNEDVGAYLLGALDHGERSAFEQHAAGCHVCQDELDRLRVAADALPRSVVQYEPPASLKHALMREVYSHSDAATPAPAPKRERRRFHFAMPRLAFAAAACALAVGVLVGYGISSGGGDGGGSTRTISAQVDKDRIGDARATLVAGSSGSQFRMSGMPQLRRGQTYQVWLKRGNRIEPGPLFSVDRNGNGAGAVPSDLGGVDSVMVTRERAGGARQPTEAPIVVART